MQQNTDATRVAGYKTCRALDHQVMAKETALRILAPMRYEKDDGRDGEKTSDWPIGEYSNSVPTIGPIAALTPSTDHDFDDLDLVIDDGPTFE
jgi:hypothetical protein